MPFKQTTQFVDGSRFTDWNWAWKTSGQLLDALYAFSIKDDHTRGCPTRILELPYWNIPPKYWGAILRTKIPQGLSGISMVCHYYLFLSLFTSLPRIMLILGGPDGISDSVRETMRKVLDAWLNYELARQPCLKIGTIITGAFLCTGFGHIYVTLCWSFQLAMGCFSIFFPW